MFRSSKQIIYKYFKIQQKFVQVTEKEAKRVRFKEPIGIKLTRVKFADNWKHLRKQDFRSIDTKFWIQIGQLVRFLHARPKQIFSEIINILTCLNDYEIDEQFVNLYLMIIEAELDNIVDMLKISNLKPLQSLDEQITAIQELLEIHKNLKNNIIK